MAYQKPGKLFIYFGCKPPVKIYTPLHLQLKNKNIFATMHSNAGAATTFPEIKSAIH
jgi:hypothetical protein